MGRVTKVKTVEISKLKPYENNAKRHTGIQLEKLSKSIEEFGFISPVLIDKDFNIIAGHGRTEAAKQIGIKSVPCVEIEGLTEEQRKAYILADNRLAEFGQWDYDLVRAEIGELETLEFDIESLDLKFPELPDNELGYYGDERERTNKAYNLDKVYSTELTQDFWQMPVIYNDNFVPERLIGFNYAKTSEDKKTGIHFFIDDYQFERVWNSPEKYTDILAEYDCILSPDFSLYGDMPTPMKIWNIYRSRQIGAYYQSCGLKVIPTISWADESSYQYCFCGIPEGSIVAISTVGINKDTDAAECYRNGVEAMIAAIKPSKIILYGGHVECDYHGIETINFKNEVTKRWNDGR